MADGEGHSHENRSDLVLWVGDGESRPASVVSTPASVSGVPQPTTPRSLFGGSEGQGGSATTGDEMPFARGSSGAGVASGFFQVKCQVKKCTMKIMRQPSKTLV